jgi:hypothetical protein
MLAAATETQRLRGKNSSPTSVLASAAEGPCAPRASCRWLILMALVFLHHHHPRDRHLFLDALPCSSPTSLVLLPIPRGKVSFRMLPIPAIPYFKRPAALLRPSGSLFLVPDSSSFKTSSLRLQYLKPQAFKPSNLTSPSCQGSILSRFQACTRSPHSRFAIHFFRHRKISIQTIIPLLAVVGSQPPYDRFPLLSCGHYESG